MIPEEGLSSEFISLRVAYSTSSVSLSQETQRSSVAALNTNLCSALGFDLNRNSSECPRIHRKNVTRPGTRSNVSTFSMNSREGLTFQAEIICNLVCMILKLPWDHTLLVLAVWIERALWGKPEHGKYAVYWWHAAFQQVVMYSWLDFIPAITSFIIAPAAVGLCLAYIKLPLITGYFHRDLCWAYVCNLVTRYHVASVDHKQYMLSFISFAAGRRFFSRAQDINGQCQLCCIAIFIGLLPRFLISHGGQWTPQEVWIFD